MAGIGWRSAASMACESAIADGKRSSGDFAMARWMTLSSP
jgi:hypothetical protein